MRVLLRDVIEIPERFGDNDYVLRLSEGVEARRLAATLAEYVVTDSLVGCFDQALGLVDAALRSGLSKAAFLKGSFGAGKSHFMAVLYALLGGEPAARAIPELAAVVADHDRTLEGKQILRLAFHFLDATSMESVILGGYLRQIWQLHPGCELPAVHRSDAVLDNADRQRARMGDEAFFAELDSGAVSDDPWSSVLDSRWNPDSYLRARSAAPESDDRRSLVSDLVRVYFTGYLQTAEFVPLDEGLSAISAHAKSLGYDAITLFCDELVLWLAFKVRDAAFFSREAQKITNLVEGQHARPIPLISFVARQLDLRTYFLQSGGMGAEQDALDNAFRHQDGRFASITLGDANLPYVAEKRLLQPIDASARQTIDDAFARLDRRPEVWDVLLDGANTDELHRGSDQDAFRRTYPFSPALVSTLRTLASAMQRDRTALKVMQQLLVTQRDQLTIDSVIPVGDIFDLIVQGENAVSDEMKAKFANARKLYEDHLLKLLCSENQVTEDEVAGLPSNHPFRADDRLVKTLLLSAVAPEVPALRDLTGSRLASLNHGSIVSPLPGAEASLVLEKVRRWQGNVPEIHVGEDSLDPIITVRIAEVDYESVITRARVEDSEGRRRELLKRLVWQAFKLNERDEDLQGINRHRLLWRGSGREIEVLFGNIRDTTWLTDDSFRASLGGWRFIVDYPFDADGHNSREDLERLDELTSRLTERTVAWVPHFLSRERQAELGRLVILEYLLDASVDRWTSYANRLAEVERAQARSLLESLRTALLAKLERAVQEAYGATSATPGTLAQEESHARVLISLHPEFDPAQPIGHNLTAAFSNLIDQAFTASYPGHPRFEPADREIKTGELAAVLEAAESAQSLEGGLLAVESSRREQIRRVANPLGVGRMGETSFVFNAEQFSWDQTFTLGMGRAGLELDAPVTVEQARGWIEGVQPRRGLTPAVSDLVICLWAVLHNRSWYRYGAPLIPAPKPGTLERDMELRPEPLPNTVDWQRAGDRAGALLGLSFNRYLTGASVAELAEKARVFATELNRPTADLMRELNTAYRRLGLDPDEPSGRFATARAAQALLSQIRDAGSDRIAVITALSTCSLPSTDQATGRSLKTADAVAQALAGFDWERLEPLRVAGDDDSGRRAAAILETARAALRADELAQPLGNALRDAEAAAYRWLAEGRPRSAPPATPPRLPESPTERSARIVDESSLRQAERALRDFIAAHPGQPVTVQWRLDQ